MADEYDEYGSYQPKPKTPILYWVGWLAVAGSMSAGAIGCFQRGRNWMGISLLAAVVASFAIFFRNRHQRHLETRD